MIIDAHSHWLPEEIIKNAHFFSAAWGNIEGQLKGMDEAGIDKAVLSYPTSDAHLKLDNFSRVVGIYNDNVAEILKRHPKRFFGAAMLPFDSEQGVLGELKRATEELGFSAVSLATSQGAVYLDDSRYLPLYRYVQEKRIPIFVHSQIVSPIGWERLQDPLLTPVIEYIFDTTVCIGRLLMSGVLRDYPEVKFIFGYFGGVTAHLAGRFDATYQMLRQIDFVKDLGGNPTQYLKNIYVDSSGDTTPTNFLAALKLFGAGHLLWGSDWPAKQDTRVSLSAVRKLEIKDKDKEGILGGNLEKVFGAVKI